MRVTVRVQSVVGHKNNSIARGQTDSESDTNIAACLTGRTGAEIRAVSQYSRVNFILFYSLYMMSLVVSGLDARELFN